MQDNNLQIPRNVVTLRAQVEDKLRNAIANGVFKPGQRLIERELCESIGVGRTCIREALRQLEAEGLVTTYAHKGPVVSKLSVDEARHLYEIRALLEGYAGRTFARRRTDSELNLLDAAYLEIERSARSGEQRRLVEAKNTFYGILLDGSGNPYVKQMLTILHNRVNLLRATSMTHPGRLENSLKEIRRICAAVHAGDSADAEAACIAHIEAAAKVALAVLDTHSEGDDMDSPENQHVAETARY